MKKRINGKFVALIAAVLLIALSIYKVPHFINVRKLEKLGYSQEAISAIYKKGLRSTIIKNEYYSDYLNNEVVKDSFNKDYLRLYTVNYELNDDYFFLYDRLKELKEYNDDELTKLFGELKYHNLLPLVVFDKLDDIDIYIEDCNSHSENSKDIFNVDGDYLKPYENVEDVEEPNLIETFVSKKFNIGDYAPEKLVPIQTLNSVPDQQLESRALEAFNKMCLALRDVDAPIYAVASYRDYDYLNEVHQSYGGGEQADNMVTRAGFSDNQLGLSVSVVASENESVSNFESTKAYNWLIEHGHEYGFIQRYPKGKKAITGVDGQSNYFRFVGEELATAIKNSGLTFDEYYMLYLH